MWRILLIWIMLAAFCQNFSNGKSTNEHATGSTYSRISNERKRSFDPLNCDGKRYRKDLRALNKSERAEWQDAILELIAERETKKHGFWDKLVQIHSTYSGEAHGGSYFLPWHRFFLLLLENKIRSQGRPDFTLPYWDWTVDSRNGAQSKIWRASFAGGATTSQTGRGNPIPDGPFQNITAKLHNPHSVRRNFNSGVNDGMRRLPGPSVIDRIIGAKNFETFAVNLELSHGIVHVAVGGDMGSVSISPNDPIFYLHHAFVDYIYSRRQQIAGKDQFGGSHDFPRRVRKASSNYTLRAFQRPTKDAFDIPCVKYVPFIPHADGSTFLVQSFPQPIPDLSILQEACYEEKVRMRISLEKCLNATKNL